MKRKKCNPLPIQVQNPFPMSDICGTWISLYGSPRLKIFYDGSRFRLQFFYKQDAAFTIPLRQNRGITYFYFYGIMGVTYDDERDLLLLTTEGEYKRVFDET